MQSYLPYKRSLICKMLWMRANKTVRISFRYLSLAGNCPANDVVTEQPQYSAFICFFSTWQNTETMLISNDLRLIFTCSLFLA